MVITTGSTLGPLEILAPISGDGAEPFYRATDRRLNRTVAIRMLPAASARQAEARRRLLHEAEVAAAFTHPGVVSLLEIGEDDEDGGLYAVYEDVRGTTLDTVLAERHFSASRTISLVIDLAETVADIHSEGMVHGGLSPAAVMVGPSGSPRVLYLGVGTHVNGTGANARAYVAPELLRGEPIDGQADVFSLGAMFVRMLTGRPPMLGATADELAGQLDQSFPSDIRSTVRSALSPNPDHRCGSAAMAAELRAAAAIIELRNR
jgi:serine/threonine protein kinase